MASRSRRNRTSERTRAGELIGVLLVMAALFATLSLVTYDAADGSWFTDPSPERVRNWGGRVGANVGEALLQSFGTCALLVPGILFVLGWNKLRGRGWTRSWPRAAGFAALFLVLCSLLDLLFHRIEWGGADHFLAGGWVGRLLASGERAILNTPGAVIVSTTLLVAIMLLTTRLSFVRLGETVAAWAGAGASGALALWRDRAARRAEATTPSTPSRRRDRDAALDEQEDEDASEGRPEDEDVDGEEIDEEIEEEQDVAEDEEPAAAARPARPPAIVPTAAMRGRAARPSPPPSKQASLPLGSSPDGGFALPPDELLREPEPQEGDEESDLLDRAELLTRKFQEFKIGGSVEAIHPGPVVTTFEFKPEAGIKYSKVTSMVHDLALGLKAEAVRIDRIPGKSTIGIEVPNRSRQMIYPKELLVSEKFRRSPSKLTLALGKDIGGDVYVSELDRMPHLLIAGATGAGKSVGLNMMIASILYKATPHDVRFIMIDTKMIELGLYSDIPHLLVPVVTDPRNASAALKWAVREMEGRYRRLAALGVRNITQFNEVLKKEPGRTMTNERTGEEIPLEHLPYLVIVIDEMADLMMVSSADVEESIMRLAQMARAVGIHLILATQRPSVDVITGTIKANFPCRIAFRVSQRVDSRTIIDQQGAEHLLGRGDMLFIPPQSSRLLRLHGAYITEAELGRVIAFLKKTGKPAYDDTVLEDPTDEAVPGYEGGEIDEKFFDAVRLVLDEGQCSITMIQRRLKLGYARAARVVDSMEQAGIVSKGEGAKPREVLVGPEILEQLRARP